MSAYSNLIGLYPTSEEKLEELLSLLDKDPQKWPEDIPYQSIPVHTAPQETDYVGCYSLYSIEHSLFVVDGC